MGTTIDGLSSGLDTTSLINSQLAVETIPQNLLKAKVTTTQTFVSALQSLNSRVSGLGDLATATAASGALNLLSTTSSSDKVVASVTTSAAPGDIEIVVGALAKAQKSVTAAMPSWPDSPPKLTIVGSDGTSTEITPASGSLDDVVSAIRNAGVGVNAVKVAAGTDANTGEPLYRLQLSSTATGEKGAFEVYRGTASDVSGGTATNLLTSPGAATISAAQDARVTLYAGTAAEQSISSATNTFSELLPGVSVTVSAVSADPVTVSVARDDAAISTKAKDLVAGINGVFSLISVNSSVSTSTSSTGTTSTKGGLFTGDSMVRDVNQKVLTAASAPVNGRSPSEFGISVTKSGTIEFDADKFAAALAKDPALVESVVQTIATRVAAVAATASDKYDGQITAKITGKQSEVRTLGTQIDSWDTRLAARRASLQTTYAALEVQLSNLTAQSTWLASQVSALTSSSS